MSDPGKEPARQQTEGRTKRPPGRAWRLARGSVGALVLLGVALALVARTQWVTREVVRRVQSLVRSQSGLDVSYAYVGWSWSHLAARLERVRVRHPREGLLASAEAIEVRPAFAALFSSQVRLTSVTVEGGEVRLIVRGDALVNGPTLPPAQPNAPPPTDVPFDDLAINDLRVRVEHDRLGAVTLPGIDVDVRNERERRRILFGVLSRAGSLERTPCFSGPIDRIEARGALEDFRSLRVALARVEAGGVRAYVRDAQVPLDLRGPIRVDAELSGDVATLTCPLHMAAARPGDVPDFHGAVSAAVQGTLRGVDPLRFEASGRVQAQHLAMVFSLPAPDQRRFGYSLGDTVDLHFAGDHEHGVRVTSLRAEHSGAVVTSPGSHPERPLVFTLGPCPADAVPPGMAAPPLCPTLAGHIDIAHFELDQLFESISLTSFAKVLWTIDASAEFRGEFWRFGLPVDPRRPALAIDFEADTRNFAILRDYHQWLPRTPVLAIPRGTVTAQMTVDPENVRFKNCNAHFGVGGRSHATVEEVRIRTFYRPDMQDFTLVGGRADNVHLEDIGSIAGIPMAGVASATAEGGGPFANPIVTGQAHLQNFQFGGLPFGNYDTRREHPWRYEDLRAELPYADGRAGQSTFTVRDAFLDFRQWTLRTGARISSDQFTFADYFHMFEFEGDPLWEPFSGGTMRACNADGASSNGDPCLTAGDIAARRTANPRRTGHVDADVSYVLGRPGDDRQGVMTVDVRATDLFGHFTSRAADGEVIDDELLTHLDAHFRYDWLVRARGSRGARQVLEYGRGRFAGGHVDISGGADLGGRLHFAGSARDIDLAQTGVFRGTGVTGRGFGSLVLTGTPESQRWSLDVDLRNVSAAQRNFGDVALRIRANPDPAVPAVASPADHPPDSLWHVDLTALDGVARANVDARVPWRAISWRDPDGAAHPDWERVWRDAIASGYAELTRPVDLVPWLPTRFLARVGADTHAQARVHVDIESAVYSHWRDARARLLVDHLDAGAQGLRLALDPGDALAVCLRDGRWWVHPPAVADAHNCESVPTYLRGASPTLARRDTPLASELAGPRGTRVRMGGGGTLRGGLAVLLGGSADVAQVAAELPGVTYARGRGSFEVRVTGNSDDPRLTGSLELRDGAVGVEGLPLPVEDVNLRVRLDGTDVSLEEARLRFGTGTVDLAGGSAHIAGRGIERLEVPVIVRALSLVPQPGVEVALDADARVQWDGETLPRLLGNVTLGRVRYTRPISLSQDLSGNSRVSSDGEEDRFDPRGERVAIDLTVRAREPIRVVNNLAEVDIAIVDSDRPFRIVGTNQRYGVLGALNIPRGRVFFRGNEFEMRRGVIEFDSAERIRPSFDVSAATELRRSNDTSRNQWRIDLHAYGRPDRFSLDMTSEPALSREDIALMLTLRMTRAELDSIGAGNVGQLLAIEALSNATGVDRLVRQNIPIIDDFSLGSGYSPSTGRTVPQVTIGRRINDGMRLGATVNTSERSEVRATFDVQLNNTWGLQVGWDNINDQGSSAFGNAGLDLRWRLRLE